MYTHIMYIYIYIYMCRKSPASRRGQDKHGFHKRTTSPDILQYVGLSAHVLPYFAIVCHMLWHFAMYCNMLSILSRESSLG